MSRMPCAIARGQLSPSCKGGETQRNPEALTACASGRHRQTDQPRWCSMPAPSVALSAFPSTTYFEEIGLTTRSSAPPTSTAILR